MCVVVRILDRFVFGPSYGSHPAAVTAKARASVLEPAGARPESALEDSRRVVGCPGIGIPIPENEASGMRQGDGPHHPPLCPAPRATQLSRVLQELRQGQVRGGCRRRSAVARTLLRPWLCL